MSLGYNIETINNSTIIFHLEGQILEHIETINLLHEVEKAIEENKTHIICNLKELQYLNSVGLNLLIKVLTKIRNNGGELIITNVSPKIEKLLVITKLNSIFKIFPTIDDAINSLKEKSN